MRKFVKPCFGMDVIASESPVDGRRGVEDDIRTSMIVACTAGLASWFAAWNAAFKGDAVTYTTS